MSTQVASSWLLIFPPA